MGLRDRFDDAADTVASVVASVFLTTPDHPARGGNTGESSGLGETEDDPEADRWDLDPERDTDSDGESEDDTRADADLADDVKGDGDET